MRRGIIWLLCVLLALLPGASQAQARQYELSYSVDVDKVLETNSELYSIAGVEAYAEGMRYVGQSTKDMIQSIVDALTFRAQVQENGIRLSASLNNMEVMDLAVLVENDTLKATSAILPGYALCVPLAEVRKLAEQVDWGQLSDELLEETMDWAASLPCMEEVGSFAGDTYDGGTARTTYTATDKDIALLLEGLLLRVEAYDDVTAMVDAVLGEGTAPKMMHQLRQFVYDTALGSQYYYTVIVVRENPEDDEPKAYSLNVFEGEALKATFSVNVANAEEAHWVLGVPLGDTVAYVEQVNGKDRGEMNAYQAVAGTSFAAAKEDGAARTYQGVVTTRTEDKEGCRSKAFNMSQTWFDNNEKRLEQQAALQIKRQDTPYHFLLKETQDGGVVQIIGQECEPFALEEGLTAIDIRSMTEDDTDALNDALQKGMQRMNVRFFKAMPKKFVEQVINLITQLQ